MISPMPLTRVKLGLLLGVLCIGTYTVGQIRSCVPEPHTPPDDLRSSLEARLSKFIAAQAQGRWDEVEELLGTKDVVYKSSHRQCLISRMQELRIVSFDLSTPDLYTCTTQMDLPSGGIDRVTAEQLPWYVRGAAVFQTPSET